VTAREAGRRLRQGSGSGSEPGGQRAAKAAQARRQCRRSARAASQLPAPRTCGSRARGTRQRQPAAARASPTSPPVDDKRPPRRSADHAAAGGWGSARDALVKPATKLAMGSLLRAAVGRLGQAAAQHRAGGNPHWHGGQKQDGFEDRCWLVCRVTGVRHREMLSVLPAQAEAGWRRTAHGLPCSHASVTCAPLLPPAAAVAEAEAHACSSCLLAHPAREAQRGISSCCDRRRSLH